MALASPSSGSGQIASSAPPPAEFRDEYLGSAAALLRPLIEDEGYVLPTIIKVSTSCTSKGRRGTAAGETYPPEASSGNFAEIQIVPAIADPLRVHLRLMWHLCEPPGDLTWGHKRRFATLAAKLGLSGTVSKPVATAELIERLNAVSAVLGPYPHHVLDVNYGKSVKQGTRLRAARCAACDYKVYIATKHAMTGFPPCAVHKENGPLQLDTPFVELPDAPRLLGGDANDSRQLLSDADEAPYTGALQDVRKQDVAAAERAVVSVGGSHAGDQANAEPGPMLQGKAVLSRSVRLPRTRRGPARPTRHRRSLDLWLNRPAR